MRIILLECKKAFTSPVLIGLLLLFSAFNIFLILNQSNRNEELQVVNQMIDTYGRKITQESLSRMKEDLQKERPGVNETLAISNPLRLKEMLLNTAESIDSLYGQLDWQKVAEAEIRKYRLSGSAAEMLRNEYEKFSQRFAEMIQNGENKEWFFPGKPLMMHSFLFRTIFGHLVFESLILIVLATAMMTNFEFENKTHLVTYATKRGRRLMKDKLIASLITASSITAFLFIVTLVPYFSVFDYSHVWGSSISSALNWEYQLPYVTWWKMSFSSYFIWGIVLLYVCNLLFSTITFVISLFVKNSYFTFFLFASLFVIAIMLPGFMPSTLGLIIIAGFNLSVLVMNPHIFFMGSEGLTMFKNYEAITIGVWTLIIGISSFFSLKKFNRLEIH